MAVLVTFSCGTFKHVLLDILLLYGLRHVTHTLPQLLTELITHLARSFPSGPHLSIALAIGSLMHTMVLLLTLAVRA